MVRDIPATNPFISLEWRQFKACSGDTSASGCASYWSNAWVCCTNGRHCISWRRFYWPPFQCWFGKHVVVSCCCTGAAGYNFTKNVSVCVYLLCGLCFLEEWSSAESFPLEKCSVKYIRSCNTLLTYVSISRGNIWKVRLRRWCACRCKMARTRAKFVAFCLSLIEFLGKNPKKQ